MNQKKETIVAVFKTGYAIRYVIGVLPGLINNPDVSYIVNEQTGEVY